MSFDTVIAVDWSARSSLSPRRPVADAIFICCKHRAEPPEHPLYFRGRASALAYLYDLLERALSRAARVLIGFDFGFGYPRGFAKALTGSDSPLAVWNWLAERIEDRPDNSNNRFQVAAEINNRFPGIGPFWGAPAAHTYAGLPHRGSLRVGHGLPDLRLTEQASGSAQSAWKLFTTGAVGSQTLLGISHLAGLRHWLGKRGSVWPFETQAKQSSASVILTEIYPSLLSIPSAKSLTAAYPNEPYHVLDARQVWAACNFMSSLTDRSQNAASALSEMVAAVPKPVLKEEGWIFGLSAQGAMGC